ncbi:hypothetical protein GC163_16900 [bacterium]|nr:hypothetical protein [bacterium]
MTAQIDRPGLADSASWVRELEERFRERDPSVFFVLPRVLRRVLRNELEITNPWNRVPHRKTYVISRDRLLWLVAIDELGVESTALVPDRALLIARPEEDRLDAFTAESLARYYWRMVYHAKLDAILQERTSPRYMTLAQLRHRIDLLGQEQFDEIRTVLKQEGYLTHPEDARLVYAEFGSVFAELQAFAPDLIPIYFPSLNDPGTVVKLLRDDCDTLKWLEATRPIELNSTRSATSAEEIARQGELLPATPAVHRPSRWRYRWLIKSAARLRAQGNTMRAAVYCRRARQVAPPLAMTEIANQIEADVALFAVRLQRALEFDQEETERWQAMCDCLLVSAERGFWNANARLLYDLQNVCVDSERETYRVDLAGWIWSRGKQPLRRPLPDLKLVLVTKHLRRAIKRISAVRMDREHRRELAELLHHAAEQAEELLRRQLAPQLLDALQTAGFQPQSVVEQAALSKMQDELLDAVVDRGFVTLGNLRDSVSRGQLKLSDVPNVQEFLSGDRLLRADRHLATGLDGVYLRGPFYLRWLQRMTSLFFGTHPGRLITQYIALPFGGAFVMLKGLQLLWEEINHFLHGHKLQLYSHTAMLGLGIILLGLIHWPFLRQMCAVVLHSTWLLVHGLLVDVPRFLYRLPGMAWFLRSVPALLFRRYLLSPLLLTLVLWKVLPAMGMYTAFNGWLAAGVLLVNLLLLNSRVGRDSEELIWEALGKLWHRFRVTVVIGLLNLVIDVFRQVMDALERVLYSVDEWLRFRTGESQIMLGVKAVLGLVWNVVHGVIRFCVTLLIEPQINPIKHFPVVTVSHKLLLPSVLYFATLLDTFTDPITAKAIATAVVTCIPGIFGFLAWELKENWRAYAANRPTNLEPSVVGHHGETVLRLLTPGFHSGTIPKLFARRRRVARKSQIQPDINRSAKYDERLHHEAASIVHFVDRELLLLLRLSRRLQDVPLSIQGVDLSTNRISVRIGRADQADALRITFAEQSGWLVAGVQIPSWVRALTADQKQVLATALQGLYKFAAVDLVREHIEQQFGNPPHPYDISEVGLIVWPTPSYDAELTYSLEERPTIVPRPKSIARVAGLEPVPANALIFALHPVPLADWIAYWDAEQHDPLPSPLLADVPVMLTRP